MHVAGLPDLRHRRIDQGVAGLAITPGLEQRLRARPLLPDDGIVGRLEGPCGHMREIAQDLRVKIAPDQLVEPDRCAFISLLL